MDKVLVHRGFSTLNVITVALSVVVVFEIILSGLRTYILHIVQVGLMLSWVPNSSGIYWRYRSLILRVVVLVILLPGKRIRPDP